jgi:hypothetical protein
MLGPAGCAGSGLPRRRRAPVGRAGRLRPLCRRAGAGFSIKWSTSGSCSLPRRCSPFCRRLHFVAFRGTDNTLVGWKEDFNMTFQTPVARQLEAADYLRRAAGGPARDAHSRGTLQRAGNWRSMPPPAPDRGGARAHPPRSGPSTGRALRDSLLRTEGYLAVREKLRTFVPQSSVVG